MNRVDVNSLITDLSSNQVEIQISSLDQLCDLAGHIAELGVVALERGPVRFLIAERLHRLGSIVVDPLEELLKETQDNEVQILASLVLLRLGSRSGLPYLLKAITDSHEYSGLAANQLAKNKVIGVPDKIVAKLRSTDSSDINLIMSLLAALKTFGAELPSDLQRKFTEPSIAWQVRTMIE